MAGVFLFMDLLPIDFYLEGNVTEIAPRLLGTTLVTYIDGITTSGKIVEVEAYSGRNDKACHANNGRRTKRNEIMYASGGVAYVYLCYGIHNMFNIVTNREGSADAILIRAIEPILGVEYMKQRKAINNRTSKLGAGPGNVCKALGIELSHNGINLGQDIIWIEKGINIPNSDIVKTTRIGVDYAGEDALLPWRYYIRGNASVSKK